MSDQGERFLKSRRRARRRQLLVFWDLLTVMLQAGYDLAYAWPETLKTLRSELDPPLFRLLLKPENTGFAEHLQLLGQSYPEPAHRLWFQVLEPLYREGGPLVPSLSALAQALREEEEREWQAHLRGLPLKTSLVLALFFVVPALALIFMTLLGEMAETVG